eukprot:767225-Hanusia_phi.AAC.3
MPRQNLSDNNSSARCDTSIRIDPLISTCCQELRNSLSTALNLGVQSCMRAAAERYPHTLPSTRFIGQSRLVISQRFHRETNQEGLFKQKIRNNTLSKLTL